MRGVQGWTMVGLAAAACLLGAPRRSAAFPHIVRPGESAATIAERVYGRVELEQLVVATNGLDQGASSAIVPGMRLELPARGHHQVSAGETWASIASDLLGDPKRADVLSQINDSHPWLPPAVGREIVIPYNLRYVASRGDTTQTVAYRLLGRRDQAWLVASYNGLRRARLRQGEVLLVPLTDLELTPEGRREALLSGALVRSQAGGAARAAQERAQKELPALARDVRRGRYVEAVRRGATLLGGGAMTAKQRADTHRLLTVAFVALGARGLASTSCAAWRRADPEAALDPIEHSPKVLDACASGVADDAPDGGVP